MLTHTERLQRARAERDKAIHAVERADARLEAAAEAVARLQWAELATEGDVITALDGTRGTVLAVEYDTEQDTYNLRVFTGKGATAQIIDVPGHKIKSLSKGAE